MTSLPKPAPRVRKPPKRIQRSAPIARKSTPRKKRKGKRASIARECDRLWSLIVKRKGRCDECGSAQYLQAAHGISRRYRATRWLPINGFALCRKHHVFWTHRPLEWTEWLRAAWGDLGLMELHYLALKNEKQDMPAVLAKLRAEAASLGIA